MKKGPEVLAELAGALCERSGAEHCQRGKDATIHRTQTRSTI
jgi:hypothetical protein